MAINETYLGDPVSASKELYARDLNDYYSKHLLTQPTSSYESAQKQMANMNPLWWMNTLTVSATFKLLPDYVRYFSIYDEKFFLRAGAVHTEMGIVYPHIVESKDIPKPGENLVTPRAQYLKIIQEVSGKDTIHLRTHVDQRLFDHSERFFSFTEYASVMQQYITVMARANHLFMDAMFTGMIIGLTGGSVLFDTQTDLEILFSASGKEIRPTEEWSKQAAEFFKKDGNIVKTIKKQAGECMESMKNKGVFDPSLIRTEWDFVKKAPDNIELKDFRETLFPDISDLAKTKKWLQSMYSNKTSDGKHIQKPISRAKSLWGLMEAISYKISRMVSVVSRENWMSFDTTRKTVDSNSKMDFPLMCGKSDLVVFMNVDDYNACLRVTKSSNGSFDSYHNDILSGLMGDGVKFFGVSYMLPGTFLILHKDAIKIITFLDRTDKEEFKYHLVSTWIRHTMYRIVFFRNFPGFFGSMKEFQPNSVWLSKNFGFWKDAA